MRDDMMTNSDIEVTINEKAYYVIEDKKRGKWIKLDPIYAPSGLHIVFPDKRQHHYDVYDVIGNKKAPIKLEGYSEHGHLYMKSGQTIWDIDPEKEPKVIPTVPANMKIFPSGSKTVVQSDAPGWCIAIVKED